MIDKPTFAAAFVRVKRTKTKRGAVTKGAPVNHLVLALYFPLVPILLPTPVTKSYPVLQVKAQAAPETISRKSPVPVLE